MIVKNFFEDLNVFRVNTCPDRAYYLPAAAKKEALERKPGSYTSRTVLLNGDWYFAYRKTSGSSKKSSGRRILTSPAFPPSMSPRSGR